MNAFAENLSRGYGGGLLLKLPALQRDRLRLSRFGSAASTPVSGDNRMAVRPAIPGFWLRGRINVTFGCSTQGSVARIANPRNQVAYKEEK